MKKFGWINLLLIAASLLSFMPAYAQDVSPDSPVYIVQTGDTLGGIARRFGVTLDSLLAANGILDANLVSVGISLVIPGLAGVSGVLTTIQVPYGENLRSLSRRYQVPVEMLARLNHLTSPVELYTGAELVIPQPENETLQARRVQLTPGQSILELAVTSGVNPWVLARTNNLLLSSMALPGDPLLLLDKGDSGPGGLPGEIQAVEITPLPFRQGRTGIIRLAADAGLTLEGELMGHPLQFFPDGQGSYIALLGVHAMAETGLYPLTLKGSLADGSSFGFSQMVGIGPVDYPHDRPLNVDPKTIDPAVTRPEDIQWTGLARQATSERLWTGKFRLPSPLPEDYCLETGECWSSRFGNRRSYNGSAYLYFHTGLDIVGKIGTEIYAPADGVVVFSGPLTVRGNATMINHGWGVYTGYMHQSEMYVEAGDRVEAGQLIGLVGATGRVEGPHLHWEVWVGGVQVDPLEWLAQTIP